jgi:hypothetical protein
MMTIQAVEVQNRYEIYLSFCEETQSTPVEFEDWAKAEGYDVDPEYGPLETLQKPSQTQAQDKLLPSTNLSSPCSEGWVSDSSPSEAAIG